MNNVKMFLIFLTLTFFFLLNFWKGYKTEVREKLSGGFVVRQPSQRWR